VIYLPLPANRNTFTKKIVQKAKDHPVKMYFDRGIMVNINTDDPVFFKIKSFLKNRKLCDDGFQ